MARACFRSMLMMQQSVRRKQKEEEAQTWLIRKFTCPDASISEHVSACVCTCIHVFISIYCIHYVIYSDLHKNVTSCTHYIKNCVIIICRPICIFSERLTCPGGPRHKQCGVSRGSPRSQNIIQRCDRNKVIFY